MSDDFIKTEIVNPDPSNFYRQKLCELREVIYKCMDLDGICPICQSSAHHKDDCGFDRIEMELAAEARKKL